MNNTSRRTAVLFLVSMLTVPALFAWGRDGHQIVATIGARGLSVAAAAQVSQLLDGKAMADVASLPDEWRKTEPETAGWHFVNVPKSDTAYDQNRDCPPQSGEVSRNCAVAAIEHFKNVLADTTQSKDVRARALTFVIHFIGDIHQPLHNAANHHRGGNEVPVTWFGHASFQFEDKTISYNLHSVWDSEFINRTGMAVPAYAAHLLAGPQPANPAAGSTIDWVNASYRLAKSNAYVIPA